MVIRLDIEIWESDKCDTKRRGGKGVDWWGKRYRACWVLWLFCVLY
jgi:hypothetical protein